MQLQAACKTYDGPVQAKKNKSTAYNNNRVDWTWLRPHTHTRASRPECVDICNKSYVCTVQGSQDAVFAQGCGKKGRGVKPNLKRVVEHAK